MRCLPADVDPRRELLAIPSDIAGFIASTSLMPPLPPSPSPSLSVSALRHCHPPAPSPPPGCRACQVLRSRSGLRAVVLTGDLFSPPLPAGMLSFITGCFVIVVPRCTVTGVVRVARRRHQGVIWVSLGRRQGVIRESYSGSSGNSGQRSGAEHCLADRAQMESESSLHLMGNNELIILLRSCPRGPGMYLTLFS